MNKKLAVAIVSGGMDSVTLAYRLAAEGYELSMLTFDYGQRHFREISCARKCAERLGAKHQVVNVSCLNRLLPGSSLTDPSVPVPDGHYAEETMKATVVPNRNAIMLSIAWGHAVAIGAEVVAIGAHAGDHFIYPDCRRPFLQALEDCFKAGNEGFGHPGLELHAPFLEWTKATIAREAATLGVHLEETWSCYKGGDLHCGTCGTCTERREAIREAGLQDLTPYE